MKRVSWPLARFSFVDKQNGWVIAGTDTSSALLRTTDVGRTWMELPAGAW